MRNPWYNFRRPDLELRNLDKFSDGWYVYDITEFNDGGRNKISEGVKYIMENGYTWLVKDALAVIEQKLKKPAVLVKLKLNKDGSAVVTYKDLKGKVLYRQKYRWTDAKREVELIYKANGARSAGSERYDLALISLTDRFIKSMERINKKLRENSL